jgi:hypothetical protein
MRRKDTQLFPLTDNSKNSSPVQGEKDKSTQVHSRYKSFFSFSVNVQCLRIASKCCDEWR